MTSVPFGEKELYILRQAVDRAEENVGRKIVRAPDIQQMISIIEQFLKQKKLICYGGTAINNILPTKDQFYDHNIELPDYDFFSPNALADAKELADIYAKAGYIEVVAKAGVHIGTYKVFVNFQPIADITSLDKRLFKTLLKTAINIKGIYYAPPNYLRMLMYLELSRPAGDVGRWEKILKRIILLNKNYPLRGDNCKTVQFMRSFEGDPNSQDLLYKNVKESFIDQDLVFFGGYACSLYGRYMPSNQRHQIKNFPDFDVLSTEPYTSCVIVKERLKNAGFKKIKITKKTGVGEIIAPHYEIVVDQDTVAFVYEPMACHSYNTIRIKQHTVKIATIDTMLSFYLAFLYADKPYYDHNRILCMAEYLFRVQANNRLEQRGLLKRFSINCYGEQDTIETIRAKKAEIFRELKNKKNSKEFEKYFLNYTPTMLKTTVAPKKSKARKTRKARNARPKKKTKRRLLGIEL